MHESNGIDIIIALVLSDISPLSKHRMDLVLELKVRMINQNVQRNQKLMFGLELSSRNTFSYGHLILVNCLGETCPGTA